MNRISRTTSYLILLSAILLSVNVALGCFLIRQSRSAIRTQIEDRMLDVANTAAALLDGDVLSKLQAEDARTPEYQAALRTLSCFEENIELEYIYCVRDLGDGNFIFMIDPDPESPGAFGDPVISTDALREAAQGRASVDQVPYEDEWGRFYSAYSPVFDSQGSVAAIVAVDFSADWYENQISRLVNTTLVFSGISILFAAVIILFLTVRYSRRFRFLFHEMNLVSEGIETLVHEVSPHAKLEARRQEDTALSDDEIELLGERIHSLQRKLREQISFVRSQAYIDGLTGLGNRTAYENHVKQLDDKIREGTARFAIAVFDLNGLKEINDREGHEKGDWTISAAATAIETRFPDAKHYRIGGDEFIVILEDAYEDMNARLSDLREDKSRVSMSMGYAEFDPKTDMGYRMVFNRADMAMYNEKRAYYQTRGKQAWAMNTAV